MEIKFKISEEINKMTVIKLVGKDLIKGALFLNAYHY